MDVLADFLKTAEVAAQVDPAPCRNRDWEQKIGARLKSTGAARLNMLCVAGGEFSLIDTETSRQLDQGDVAFLVEGSSYRMKGLRSDATLITGSIIFRTGVMALTALNLSSATIVRGQDQPECSELVQRIANEVLQTRGGWQQVAECLAISLFITSLRASGSCQEGKESGHGWLRALVDPEIGNALKLMHRAPEYRWTVAELADELSISRSAFAERFKKITGRPPLEYLTWWRLQRAAARLRSGEISTLFEAAKTSGYQSEAAFSKAFRREFGMPPGEVRRQAQARMHTPSQLQLDIKKRNPFDSAEQEVGLNFVKSYEAIRRPFEELLGSHGLNGAEYNILRILRGRNSPMTFNEVLSHLLIPHANVPEQFASLLSKTYITLDGEASQYVITSHGLSVLRKLDEPTMSLHRRQFANFSTGEMSELNRLLVKLRTPAS